MLSILSFAALLTACGTTSKGPVDAQVVVHEHFQVIEPDQSLRSCLPKPAKPMLTTEKDTANLLVALVAWGTDCQAKLSAVWASIDQANAKAAAANAQK